jgi:hypothetical protein
MTNQELYFAAMHEAAHVVLGLYHGIPIAYAEVRAPDRGSVALDESPLTDHADNYRHYVEFYIAGVAWEEQQGPIKNHDFLRADYAMCEEECHWWSDEDSFAVIRQAKKRAKKALAECRVHHVRIAEALKENGVLQKEELMALWLA